jgi:UDP-3-O-[3-hydroxymyristoyl] glucosamine N-acyltransferase
MADPDFFKKVPGFTVQEIADITGCRIFGHCDPNFFLEDVASLMAAESNQLSFFDNSKYREFFEVTRAGVCITSEKNVDFAPQGIVLLLSDAPYTAYARAARAFYPEHRPPATIHPSAFVDKTAVIEEGTSVEAGAVIKAGAHIGKNCWIESGAVIGEHVRLGNDCRIGCNASVSHALIGNNVRLYPGARIGQDGFGFAIDPSGYIKVPQLGRVIIQDNCEIGANTTIDRGAGPDTIIGSGTWIDNLVQIGHNVKIGKGCVIVSQVGISGSTELEDYVVLGGQAGLAGHLKIGKGARIGAQSGVIRNIPAGEEHLGMPSVPSKQFMRQSALLAKMANKSSKKS